MVPDAASLLPPITAIALALLTRRVLMPLALGILVGAALMAYRDPSSSSWWWATLSRFGISIYDSVSNADHLKVLLFTILLGGTVGILESGGSLARMILACTRGVKTRRGGQMIIAVTGLAIFFDDYANTLLVGGTMRGTADRYGISRAKLAYLVDSTAAPVAGLSLVSTWVATEISYLRDGLASAGFDDPGMAFGMFMQSIPFRFYPVLALVMVFCVAWMGRDIGPMWTAEKEASKPDGEATTDATLNQSTDDSASSERHVIGDVLAGVGPIVMCLVAVFLVLYGTGAANLASHPDHRNAVEQTGFSGWIGHLGDIIGQGNSYWALVGGGAAGVFFATSGAWARGDLTTPRIVEALVRGAGQMMPAMVLLWLAWALSEMTDSKHLDTGGYLSNLLSNQIDVRWLPTCVFLLSGAIAFATGTSWGTMALLTPISVTLACKLQLSSGVMLTEIDSPIVLATFSSVLAGAIFGDHCSPLSDTTVLSSRACQCDHVLHVKTQMPYALIVGTICIVGGTLPAAQGISPWWCLLIGTIAIGLIVRFVGRKSG